MGFLIVLGNLSIYPWKQDGGIIGHLTIRDKDNMSLRVKKLKTKSLSRTGENKEETASKVKVLREKQSQWMKEREASKTATKKKLNL